MESSYENVPAIGGEVEVSSGRRRGELALKRRDGPIKGRARQRKMRGEGKTEVVGSGELGSTEEVMSEETWTAYATV